MSRRSCCTEAAVTASASADSGTRSMPSSPAAVATSCCCMMLVAAAAPSNCYQTCHGTAGVYGTAVRSLRLLTQHVEPAVVSVKLLRSLRVSHPDATALICPAMLLTLLIVLRGINVIV